MEIVTHTTREGPAAPRRETRGGRGDKGAGGPWGRGLTSARPS